MPIESSFETRRISVMRGSTQVLVKVVLFQLRGHGHPHGNATPNLLGLSNKVSFVNEFLLLVAIWMNNLSQPFINTL